MAQNKAKLGQNSSKVRLNRAIPYPNPKRISMLGYSKNR